MNKLTALIAVAGITAALCANAQAATMSDVPTETVRYTTADAASVAAVAVLYGRIDAAAGRVCGARMSPGSPFVSRTWQRCVQRALRDALVQIDTPAVAAYAAAHGIEVLDAPTARRN